MKNHHSKITNLALATAALAAGALWILIESIEFPLGMPAFGVGTVPGIGPARAASMPSTRPLTRLLEA